MNDLPWVKWPWQKRCTARITRRDVDQLYYGRCELHPHPITVEHALERGHTWIRWYDAHVRFSNP